MKIILISSHNFSTFGGYEKVLLLVFKGLKEKYNCEISILSLPLIKYSEEKPLLEDFKKFKIQRSYIYNNKLSYLFSILVKKLFNKSLLIGYDSVNNYLNELIKSDIVIITNPFLITTVKNILKKNKINKKVLYWDHGDLFSIVRSLETNSSEKSIFEFLKIKLRKLVYSKEFFESVKSADAYLAIATEIKDFIKDINPGANVNLVYNPLPLYNGKLIQRPSSPIFLYVGRLTDNDKNITFMLNGLSKIKNKEWSLKIIGTGKDENKLKNLANKLKISDRIEWLGFKKDPYSEIDYATALLLTSRWEGFPMVLVEANQRGIPVISSDCKSGPKDIVIPGVNGYLYKEGDINDFVRVISGVMDGRLQFDAPENIAKTAERFRDDIVIQNIFNFMKSCITEIGPI
jgi:UDP-D-galactose:(glucosyl)LPS alpha-1,6-D-galactosyltransferase